jgi:hypothetical protein
MFVVIFSLSLSFNSFALMLKTLPCLLSQQPPSRTTSDQQIRSSSKSHPREQTQTQRPATGATKSSKKSGFTLASPALVAQQIEAEGDSDEWVSSSSLSVTPQNQSSDEESGDEGDEVVQNLPHLATSPDDREPPTPTVPRVKMQPPTPVNNVKEQRRHRLSTTSVPNEVAGASAAGDGVDRHDKERSALSAAHDQESVEDYRYPQSDHHPAHPEEGLASTPRPRAIVDRDTETSRHLLPAPLSDPPSGPDSTVRESSVVNHPLGADVQDRPQQPSAPKPHPPHITKNSPGPRTDNNPQGRDQITMTQVSEDLPLRIIPSLKHVALP